MLPLETVLIKRLPFGHTAGRMILAGKSVPEIQKAHPGWTLWRARSYVQNVKLLTKSTEAIDLLHNNAIAVDCIRIWFGLSDYQEYMDGVGELSRANAQRIYNLFNSLGMTKMKLTRLDLSL